MSISHLWMSPGVGLTCETFIQTPVGTPWLIPKTVSPEAGYDDRYADSQAEDHYPAGQQGRGGWRLVTTGGARQEIPLLARPFAAAFVWRRPLEITIKRLVLFDSPRPAAHTVGHGLRVRIETTPLIVH